MSNFLDTPAPPKLWHHKASARVTARGERHFPVRGLPSTGLAGAGRVGARGLHMPEGGGIRGGGSRGGGEPLGGEWLRELLEEYRHGTSEMSDLRGELHGFRQDMQGMKSALSDLTKAIRGGPGEMGVVAAAAVAEERLKRIEKQLSDYADIGTPASHTALSLLEERTRANGDRLEQLERQYRQALSRGWQLGGFVVTTLIALAAIVAALVHK